MNEQLNQLKMQAEIDNNAEAATNDLVHDLIKADDLKDEDSIYDLTEELADRFDQDDMGILELARLQARGEHFKSKSLFALTDDAINEKIGKDLDATPRDSREARYNGLHEQIMHAKKQEAEKLDKADKPTSTQNQATVKGMEIVPTDNKSTESVPTSTDIVLYEKPKSKELVVRSQKQTSKELDLTDQDKTKQLPVAENGNRLGAEKASLEKRIEEFGKAKDEYARLSAGRGRRTIHAGKFSEKAVAEAGAKFEAIRDELIDQEVEVARLSGVSKEDLKKLDGSTSAQLNYALTVSLFEHRMVASGRGKFVKDDDGNIIFRETPPKTPMGKLANKFYAYWNNLEDKKHGKLRKGAITVGAGIGIGVATAATAGIILGPVLGGALGGSLAGTVANRLSKSYLFSRISKKADNLHKADDQHDFLQQGIIHGHADHIPSGVDMQTEQGVSANRNRAAKAIGAILVGVAAGEVATLGIEHAGSIFGHTANHVSHAGSHNHNHGGSHHKPHHKHEAHEGHQGKTNPQHAHNKDDISAKQANHGYVSTIYEDKLGLHKGSTNMDHAYELAHKAHELRVVYPTGNPNDFYYVTQNGHTDTASVLKVLAKYGGKVKVTK
jgi:hypothetical protein